MPAPRGLTKKLWREREMFAPRDLLKKMDYNLPMAVELRLAKNCEDVETWECLVGLSGFSHPIVHVFILGRDGDVDIHC
jgi:hypothetical protein